MPLYLLANSTSSSSQQCNNGTPPLDCLLSPPRPTKYPHLQRSCGGKGDCPLHCTPTIAHCYLLHQATSASLQALKACTNTREQAGNRNTCNHTHMFTSLRLSPLAINKQTNSKLENMQLLSITLFLHHAAHRQDGMMIDSLLPPPFLLAHKKHKMCIQFKVQTFWLLLPRVWKCFLYQHRFQVWFW